MGAKIKVPVSKLIPSPSKLNFDSASKIDALSFLGGKWAIWRTFQSCTIKHLCNSIFPVLFVEDPADNLFFVG